MACLQGIQIYQLIKVIPAFSEIEIGAKFNQDSLNGELPMNSFIYSDSEYIFPIESQELIYPLQGYAKEYTENESMENRNCKSNSNRMWVDSKVRGHRQLQLCWCESESIHMNVQVKCGLTI